jgi:hypothetical protein
VTAAFFAPTGRAAAQAQNKTAVAVITASGSRRQGKNKPAVLKLCPAA